ncbi:ATP-binding cassette domain-containing protein [Curtobacterium flaccumfaciens]|nr:ATP-binding cassette domain-containing protein [Curtobacterium flaccumfaciens]
MRAAGLTDPQRIRKAYPHELSGGQLQRAMIAMALAGDPVALIADEPTTALDVTVQAGILDLLRTLGRERDLAVLLITHDMGVVADVADEVLVMRRGDPVEHGPVAEVFAHPSAEYTRVLLDAVPSLGPPGPPDGAVAESRPERQFSRSAARDASPSASLGSAGASLAEASRASSPKVVAQLHDVAVRYARRGEPVVSGIDLELRAGETLGLVGSRGPASPPSGAHSPDSCRSSPARSRWTAATSARLGRTTAGAPQPRRHRLPGPRVLAQPRQTIGWSIAEPLLVHGTASAADRAERVRELLVAVQLDPSWAERFPHQLLRWPAAACRRRPGARTPASARDRRRADLGTRRHRAGRGARPALVAADRVRVRHAAHQPRPGGRPAARRRGRRAPRRPGRRTRQHTGGA